MTALGEMSIKKLVQHSAIGVSM